MKSKFIYENKEIEFNIIRRKRKTITIKVEENGDVSIIAPLRINKEYLITVLRNRAQWILDTKKEIQKTNSRKVKRGFDQGGSFMYLGNEYPFKLFYEKDRRNITVELVEDLSNGNNMESKNFAVKKQFIICTNTMEMEELRLALEKWYREQTLKIVTKRIDYYAENFKDKVSSIKVKEQKRRWASCTGKNAILFNWRISMARADVLDYIVVHEMCHMDYRNHSKLFWNRVAEIIPNYKEKHEWLRKNGFNLFI